MPSRSTFVDPLPINERRIACLELRGAPVGPSCVNWAPDGSALTVLCGTLLHIISPSLGIHSSLEAPLHMLRRADDPGSRVIDCFRATVEVSATAASASYDNGEHPIPLRDYSVAPVGSATDQWKAACWSLERIGPRQSYIVTALTVKGTVHLFSASGNAVAGPYEQRDLSFEVADSSDRSNIFKSRISALAWAPQNRLIGANQAGELIVWEWDAPSSRLRLKSRRACAEGPVTSLSVDVESHPSDAQGLQVAVGGAGFLRVLRLPNNEREDGSDKGALPTTAMAGMKSRSPTATAWIGGRLLWTFPGYICWHDRFSDTQGFAALGPGKDSLADPYAAACDVRRVMHPDGHGLVMLTLSAGTRYAFPEACLDGKTSLRASVKAPYKGPGPFETNRSFALDPAGSLAPVHAGGADKTDLNALERQAEVLRGLHGHAWSTSDAKTSMPSLSAYVHGSDALTMLPYHLVRYSMLTLVLTEPGPKQEGVDDPARLRSFLDSNQLEELSWAHLRALMAFHAAASSGEREGIARAILDAILEAHNRPLDDDEEKRKKLLRLTAWLQRQPGSAKLGRALTDLMSALRWRTIRLRSHQELQRATQTSFGDEPLDQDDERYIRTLCGLGGFLLSSDKATQPLQHDDVDVSHYEALQQNVKETLVHLSGSGKVGQAAYKALKADFKERGGDAIATGHVCEACGDTVPLTISSTLGGALSAHDTCPQGHVWSRCNETYRLLCESRALRCSGCGAKATLLSEFDEERSGADVEEGEGVDEDEQDDETSTDGGGRQKRNRKTTVAPRLHDALHRAQRCSDCDGLWVLL